MSIKVAYHHHALDGLFLPIRKRRVENDVIVLEDAQAEGAEGVVGVKRLPVSERYGHAGIGVGDGLDRRVETCLVWLEKLSRFGLDEVLEAALVN